MRRPFRSIDASRSRVGGGVGLHTTVDSASMRCPPPEAKACAHSPLRDNKIAITRDVDKDHISSVSLLATDLSNRSHSPTVEQRAGHCSGCWSWQLFPRASTYRQTRPAHRGVGTTYLFLRDKRENIWRVQ